MSSHIAIKTRATGLGWTRLQFGLARISGCPLCFFATFCDIVGVGYDKNEVKGRSLWPLLNGEKPAWRDRILIETNGLLGVAHTMFTIRHQHYKFSVGASGRCELYDLQNDPHEMNNLAHLPDMQPVVEQMKAILIDELKATDCHGPAAYSIIKQCR